MNDLAFLLMAAVEKSGTAADKAADAGSGIEWLAFAIVGLLATAITLGYWLSRRWRQARAQQLLNSPPHLLQELCLRHGIGRADQRLLTGLAREQKLEHPGLLFVEPRLWEANRLGSYGRRYAVPLDRLREQIFSIGR
jgi:hypothetical protein